MGKVLSTLFIFFLIPQIVLADAGGGTIEFIENRGQWEGPFLYKSITPYGDIYLEKKGFTCVVAAPDNTAKIHGVKEGKIKEAQKLHFHAYKINLLGANASEAIGSKPQNHYYNYFLGNDPKRWKSNIHPYHAVDYQNIYQGIDLHVASESMQLKYDFIISAGADASLIQLQYEGVDGLSISGGELLIKTSVGTATEAKPYAYQYINDTRVEVPCNYKLSGNTVSYIFPKGYNKSYPLVIDPTMIFATFSGSTADNWGFTATYDAAGNLYAGGATRAAGYPATIGGYDLSFNGGGSGGGNVDPTTGTPAFPCDITITKFNPGGTGMVYATYIGGSDNEQPHSLVVDAGNNLILAGRTYSTNYPVDTLTAYKDTNSGGADIVVTKLNAAGSALLGSTYVGGSGDDGVNISSLFGTFNTSLKHSYGDDARSEVLVDNAGNIYVASCTRSTNFLTVNAHQATLGGAQDAVVFKLNGALSSMLWSTYLGGAGMDAAYVLAFSKTQDAIYVSGGTGSSTFPSTVGTYKSTHSGDIDGFILKFQNGGAYPLLRGTFIGGSSYDQCYGIQLDGDGDVYVTGQSLNNGVPVFNATAFPANSSQFIIKMDQNLTSAYYSTVFGSGDPTTVNITPTAFLVDTCENVYVSGWGGSLSGSGGTTAGMPVNLGTPSPSLITSTTDGNDFYFFVMDKNASLVLFGGYYGSPNNEEHVDGGTSRFDRDGVIYQAICGGCAGPDPSTTTGAYSPTSLNSNCNLLAVKMAMNFGAVNAGFTISPNKTLCPGEAVTFTNSSANATNYLWDFGDGTNSTAQIPPPKSYSNPGTYTVRLTIYNPATCVERDTAYLTITVDTNSIDNSFTATILDTCSPFRASFTNTSKFGKNPANASFFWDFGDGTTFTGNTPPNKNFPGAGTYTVKLVMTDPTACNSPDSSSVILTFRDDNVKAGLEVPALICVSDSFRPTNTSKNASAYKWDFGDGNTSTALGPAHKYDTAGTYTVSLWAYNPTTCNKVDSVSMTITVKESPTADFTYVPLVPITNEPHVFTNKSVNAIRFNWNFGDGTGTEENNPTHLYKKSGTYNVCLVAYNQEGCTDTVCKPVTADIYPVADLPTAFSPNGDGKNDILFVRGAGVQRMNLKIYNRWGQMVFESNSLDVGWDGTYKGKKQGMEAYAYVLNVTFTDETTLYKRGNVTLLR